MLDTYYSRTLLLELESFGVDSRTLAVAAGLSGSELLQRQNFPLLASSALDLVGEVGLGLRFGRRLDITAHGVFGYALMSSASVDGALKLLVEFNRLVSPDITCALFHEGGRSGIEARVNGFSSRLEVFFLEAFFAAVHACATFLVPGSELERRQAFHFPCPPYRALYEKTFPPDLNFSAPASRMSFPSEAMELPLEMANPAAETLFREQCDKLLHDLNEGALVSSRVSQELLNRHGDFPTCAEVATRLYMSERTLRRKLRGEGASFQQILDRVRLHLAREYLQSTELPVAAIGLLLGFDDASNFRRSFRRWSGGNPADFRAAAAAHAASSRAVVRA